MLDFLRKEPALVTAFVTAVLGLATAFGLHVTDTQQGAILTFVGAALAIAGGIVIRQTVTPNAKVVTDTTDVANAAAAGLTSIITPVTPVPK